MRVNKILVGALGVLGIFVSIYLFCKNVTDGFEEKMMYYHDFYEKLVNGYGFEPSEREIFNIDVTNCIFATSLFVSSILVLFGIIFENHNIIAPWLVINGLTIAALAIFTLVVSAGWLFFLSSFLYGFFFDNENSYLFFDLSLLMGLYAIVMLVVLSVFQYPLRKGLEMYSKFKSDNLYIHVANVHRNY